MRPPDQIEDIAPNRIDISEKGRTSNSPFIANAVEPLKKDNQPYEAMKIGTE